MIHHLEQLDTFELFIVSCMFLLTAYVLTMAAVGAFALAAQWAVDACADAQDTKVVAKCAAVSCVTTTILILVWVLV